MGFLLSDRDVIRQRRVNLAVDALVSPGKFPDPPQRETNGQPVVNTASSLCEFFVQYDASERSLTSAGDSEVIDLLDTSRIPLAQFVDQLITAEPSFGIFKLASETAVEVTQTGYYELAVSLKADWASPVTARRGIVYSSIQSNRSTSPVTSWEPTVTVVMHVHHGDSEYGLDQTYDSKSLRLLAGDQLRLRISADNTDFPSAALRVATRMRIRKMATCPLGSQAIPSVALSSPADSATGVSTTPTLSWTAANADFYDIYLGTQENNEPLIGSVENPTKSFSPTTTLESTTEYFWLVIARNANGQTASLRRSFTT